MLRLTCFAFVMASTLASLSLSLLAAEDDRKDRQEGFVEIEVGRVGALLDKTLKRDGLLIFRKLPEDRRRRLMEQLSEAASVKIIERALRSTDGSIVLDPNWTPWPAIVGKSAGHIAARDLGTRSDVAYSIEVEVLDVALKQDGGRVQLLDLHLRLAGEDLGIPDRSSVHATFRWQVAVATPIATVKDKLRRRHHDRDSKGIEGIDKRKPGES